MSIMVEATNDDLEWSVNLPYNNAAQDAQDGERWAAERMRVLWADTSGGATLDVLEVWVL